jgi:hypothetical protein
VNWRCIASSSDGTHLAAAAAGSGGGIYTSTDSGLTWTKTSAPVADYYSIASSSDGTKLAAAGPGFIYTSSNSGLRWTDTAPSYVWISIASSSDGTKLAATQSNPGDTNSPGFIYTSTDSGGTWTQTSAPSEAWGSIASSSDGTHLAAVFADDGLTGSSVSGAIYTSTDSGLTWIKSSAPIASWLCIASSSDGTKLAAACANPDGTGSSGAIYTSTDSGGTWTQTSAPSVNWRCIASSSDGTHLAAAAAGSGDGIYMSTNSGLTWTNTAPYYGWVSIASSSDGTNLAAVELGASSGCIYTAYYVQQFGNLQVVLSPQTAVSAGAQWQVDGGPWQNSGVTVASLLVGNHTVSFSTLPGWGTPASQTVSITNIQTTTVTGLYIEPHPATAIAVLVSDFVVAVNVTDGGYGYTNTPQVLFIGGGGSGAQAFAVISNEVVTSIDVTDSGYGYTNAPMVLIAFPFIQTLRILLTNTPAAAATPIITNGFIVGANLTASGIDYTKPPAVTFNDSTGSGAVASAQIFNGAVTNIVINRTGSKYSPNTVINIAPAGYLNAVIPTAGNLILGLDYQLEVSSDLNTWTNQGSAFTATNATMVYPQCFAVADWNQLFFRLYVIP